MERRPCRRAVIRTCSSGSVSACSRAASRYASIVDDEETSGVHLDAVDQVAVGPLVLVHLVVDT